MAKNATHFSCVLAYSGAKLLVIDYQSRDPKTQKLSNVQIKFPGGTDDKYHGEKPLATARREFLQETHLSAEDFRLFWQSQPGQYVLSYYAYLVALSNCFGTLRDKIMDDDGDKLGRPYLMPVKALKNVLFYSHQEPFLVACHELGIM